MIGAAFLSGAAVPESRSALLGLSNVQRWLALSVEHPQGRFQLLGNVAMRSMDAQSAYFENLNLDKTCTEIQTQVELLRCFPAVRVCQCSGTNL